MKLISILLALSLLSCSKHGNQSEKGIFRHSIEDDIKTLDPANAYDSFSSLATTLIYESLFQYAYLEESFKPVPLLAASAPVFSKNGLTLTVKIRTDATFYDGKTKGRPVTAHDFIYEFKRLALPDLESSGWWIWDGKIAGINEYRKKLEAARTPEEKKKAFDENVPGFQAADDHTLIFHFTRPYPQILHILTMPFTAAVPREAVEANSDEKGNLLSRHVGSGPFYVADWKRGQHLLLKRNPTFHPEVFPRVESGAFSGPEFQLDAAKPLPLSEGIRFVIFKERQPLWLNLLQGSVDDGLIPKDHYDDAMAEGRNLKSELIEKGYRLHVESPPLYYYVQFNMRDSVVGKNKLLRQAMSAAVDRNEWIRLFTNGRGILSETFLPPGIEGRPTDLKWSFPYDPARAKALLAKAGYPGGKGLQMITFDLRGADTLSRQFGEFFVSQWEKVGIPVRAIYNSFPAFLTKVKKANYQVSYGGWGMDYPDAENAYQILYGKNQAPGPNETNFNDPRFNALYEKVAAMEPSPARSKLIREMEQILAEEVPVALGYTRVDYYMYTKRLRNYRASEMIHNYPKYIRVID